MRNMSRLYQSDGLSILARYTSVATVAIASSALVLKSAANREAVEDQVKGDASEDRRTEAGDRPGNA